MDSYITKILRNTFGTSLRGTILPETPSIPFFPENDDIAPSKFFSRIGEEDNKEKDDLITSRESTGNNSTLAGKIPEPSISESLQTIEVLPHAYTVREKPLEIHPEAILPPETMKAGIKKKGNYVPPANSPTEMIRETRTYVQSRGEIPEPENKSKTLPKEVTSKGNPVKEPLNDNIKGSHEAQFFLTANPVFNVHSGTTAEFSRHISEDHIHSRSTGEEKAAQQATGDDIIPSFIRIEPKEAGETVTPDLTPLKPLSNLPNDIPGASTKLVIGRLTVEIIRPSEVKPPPAQVMEKTVFHAYPLNRPEGSGKPGIKVKYGLGQL